MFNQMRRNLIVEESDVTTVLAAINHHQGFFSNNDKNAGNCGWAKEPTKWYVRFYASDRQWGRIAGELSKLGKIYVNVTPSGATELYYTKD
jgi:hypothetical protein